MVLVRAQHGCVAERVRQVRLTGMLAAERADLTRERRKTTGITHALIAAALVVGTGYRTLASASAMTSAISTRPPKSPKIDPG
ncbi:hypothetical protein [Methylobacterium sp. SyP6R]|uniref:hypothetical protein n=1 Tax=Methylobacterium sp. SyP6R TaxID=2718876 RepID=UPI001F3F011B|nr:hypothetical protein [Methylobacterium sp. SyP6R]MCF4124522.1 hypothetical protein [Methylobacterium sp. SyP6R]